MSYLKVSILASNSEVFMLHQHATISIGNHKHASSATSTVENTQESAMYSAKESVILTMPLP